jgi:hypothetical protein
MTFIIELPAQPGVVDPMRALGMALASGPERAT